MQNIWESFIRAWGRGLGYQAARKTGWVLVPLLVIGSLIYFAAQYLGIL
jgi:hypothetical protein